MPIMSKLRFFVEKYFLIFSRQSFSGLISQFNIWNYALQDYEIETLAGKNSEILKNFNFNFFVFILECRSDAWGNVVASKTNSFIISNEHASVGLYTTIIHKL